MFRMASVAFHTLRVYVATYANTCTMIADRVIEVSNCAYDITSPLLLIHNRYFILYQQVNTSSFLLLSDANSGWQIMMKY